MGEKLMIIISGASATGKTVLSKDLAKKLNLALINKDEIKELLFDILGVKDTTWANKLGVASFELVYLFAEKLCQTGKPFIVEGNFDSKYAAKAFSDIKSKYNYQVLQLYCHADTDVLFERYNSRNNAEDRHPGHLRMTSEEFESMLKDRNFKLDIGGSINIDIDTTKFETVDLQKIYDEIEKSVNSNFTKKS